jgi:hypothetical protein
MAFHGAGARTHGNGGDMTRVGNWVGRLLLVALSLLLAEGALHLVASRVPRVDMLLAPSWARTQSLPDSALVWRGDPRWFDHDTRGFRNSRAVDSANVVTLGDSHTYGLGVAREENWPSLVGKERPAYNMGFGGWGPGQAYLELKPALALHPSLVIFGLYFGNDFIDAYEVVSKREELRRFLPTALVDTTAALERSGPIADRAERLFSLGGNPAQQRPTGSVWSLRRYFSEHSMLYGLVRAVRNALGHGDAPPALLSRDLDQALARVSEDQRRSIMVYRGSEWKALLTPAYRNLVLDDRDPRIRAGVEATEAILAAMDTLCRAQGSRFVVVLLPTKESVFAPRIPGADRTASLDSLVRNEAKVRSEIDTSLAHLHIEYLDVLPALQASTQQPYFPDADGHPNQAGHRAIARAVLGRIQNRE